MKTGQIRELCEHSEHKLLIIEQSHLPLFLILVEVWRSKMITMVGNHFSFKLRKQMNLEVYVHDDILQGAF